MKKLLIASLLLLSFGIGLAAEILPIPFSFIGRWQPSEDPVLIDDYGLQDIQNMRKVGKHFKGIQGHTIINTTTLATAPRILNGFHFRKDQPSESHVIVLSGDTDTPTATYLYQNTTAIPTAGNFSATTLHTDAAGGIGLGRFSTAPAGNMVYSNGAETLIWGGNEIEATSFIVSSDSLTGTSSALTNANDYTDRVRNTRQTADQVATIGSNNDSTVKLLIHAEEADGTAGTGIIDSSSVGRTITAAGSAQVDTSQAAFGLGSVLFDGSGDYLTVADSTDWEFGTDAMTVDFRIRISSWPAESGGFNTLGVFGQSVDGDNYIAFTIARDVSTGICYGMFRQAVSAATTTMTNVSMGVLSLNTWYHVAVVRGWGGTANQFAVAVNGTGATNTVAATLPDLAATFSVGRATRAGTSYDTPGWIDEFRVSKGVARWTSNFTPPTAAYGTGGGYFLVGFMRPIQGVKLYVADENTTTSTLTVKEFNGSSWTDLTVTDNTAVGGISLAQTGTVTWASTVSTSKVKYVSGLSLYWYQFALSGGTATIYYCTVDAPMQSIKNIWNGRESYVAKNVKYNGSTYIDYTDEVNDDDTITTYADYSSLTATTHYILIAFTDPMQGINFSFIAGKSNGTASTQMTAYYWSGTAWSALPALSDGTATSTTSFNKNGVVSWRPPTAGSEYPTTISDEVPLYYYKIAFAGNLDAETQVGEIRGIMSPPAMAPYAFSDTFRNRLFLFNEYSGSKNQAIYSQENAPDIFNGEDSGYLYFGDNNRIVASAQVYNVFRTFAADQLIVMKDSETYRLAGDDPTTWQIQRMSANIGCTAPLSVVVCDAAEAPSEEGVKRQVVIWQSDKGFVLSDGAAIVNISDDIRCYFDPLDSRYIPTTRRGKTVAWYDSSTRSYKALISSGSSATYHNVELEYSLESKEWTKIVRSNATGADPLQSGFSVFDTSGISYTYGGNRGGYLYRLENGSTFAGTNIEQFLHTKDLILDTQAPMFRKSTVKHIRTLLKKKTAGGTISIAHYGDQTLTVNGTSNQVTPSTISMASAPYNTQSVNLGPFLYHSFKFTLSGSSTDGGMELNGLGLWSEPQTVIRP